MPYLARGSGRGAPQGTLREAIGHAAADGSLSSTLFILPTGGWARQLARFAIIQGGTRTFIQPNMFSLQEVITKFAGAIRPHKRLISDAESAVLAELTIRDLFRANKLTYYEERDSSSTYPLPRGTFEIIVAAIAGLKRHGVRPQHLKELLEEKKKRTEGIKETSELRKTHDLALIYDAYCNRLGSALTDKYGQYFDLADALERYPMYASELLAKTYPAIKRIVVCGFTSIDEPAREILNAIADTTGIQVFYEIEDVRKNPVLFKLHKDFSERQGQEGFLPVGDNEISTSPFVRHLRRFLFNDAATAAEVFDASGMITLSSAASRQDEVTQAARTVKELIRSEADGYDVSRIAVVMYRQEGYSQIVRQVFRNYGIPVSQTERLPLASSPLFVAVDSLLRLAERGLRPHLVLRLLSTPYLEFTAGGAHIDRSNLYTVISEHHLPPGRRSWQEELESILASIEVQLDTVEDDLDRRRLELEYERTKRAKSDIAVIEALIDALGKPHTPAEFVALMRNIFYEHGLVDRLLASSREMLRADALEDDTRSYRALDKLLDEFLALAPALGISGKSLPVSYYGERLRVAALKMRYAPHLEPGRGALVTSIEQVIGMDIDHLIVLGMNDGVFPELYVQPSLVPSEHHKPEDDHLAEQRFLFYQMLATSAKSIHLSYEYGVSSDEKLPSLFIHELQRVVKMATPAEKPLRILSAREFLDYYGGRSAGEKSKLALLVPALRNDIDQHLNRVLALWDERLRLSNGYIPLSSDGRAWLERMSNRIYSVSQLETYALCPFKYFERYLLALGKAARDPAEGLSPMDRGLVLHEKLRRILEHIRDLRRENLSLKDHREMTAADFEAYDPDPKHEWNAYGGIRAKHPFWRLDLEAMFDAPHTQDLFERFLEEERELFGTADGKNLLPFAFEQEFKEVALPHPEDDSKTPIRLRGKIDRIDFDAATGNMVVIDYKSKNAPKPGDIDDGLSLQLPLYLRIAEDLLAMHTGVRGVAGYYHTILGKDAARTPAIGARDFLLGLLGKQPKKNASIYKNPEDYEALAQAIDKTIGYAYEYVEGMTEGRFPLIREDRTDKCSYCDFRRSCRVHEAAENGTLPKAHKS